jgi:anion-transporting  ArsA/GET3 family ATPase
MSGDNGAGATTPYDEVDLPADGSALPEPPALDVDGLIADRSIRTVLCCGSGGVGKTTTAAALALRAAEAGRTVVVLTIDPAKRLAQSMGLDQLDNTPRAVVGVDTAAGGRLDAMMLDMKRTFDDVVLSHGDTERAKQILDNPFYRSLSSSFAGTQEYMAMEKLAQLRAGGTWDLIVVDTPPSRSALDFLDAPKRLASFLDGRFIRMISRPAKAGGRAYLRVVNLGMSAITATVSRLLGATLLQDVQTFLSAFDTMFGGFRDRAEATYAQLSQPETAFLVVATPERDALREASFFVDRLQRERMPLAGLVLNRVHTPPESALTADHARSLAEAVEEVGGVRPPGGGRRRPRASTDSPAESRDQDAVLTAGLLRLHAAAIDRGARESRAAQRFTAAHPDVPMARAEALASDVHDLDGLRAMAASLTGASA